jgi:hypothetical protein
VATSVTVNFQVAGHSNLAGKNDERANE